MIGIIITGHGHFPTGILSAVSLVAGKPEQVEAVDFQEGMSAQELRTALEEAAGRFESQEILILADLAGGTPFNQSADFCQVSTEKKIRVIGGVNMPAVVEAVFSRPMYQLDQLAEAVAAAAVQGVTDLQGLGGDDEEVEFEDGL